MMVLCYGFQNLFFFSFFFSLFSHSSPQFPCLIPCKYKSRLSFFKTIWPYSFYYYF
jgi:hypothetical protein